MIGLAGADGSRRHGQATHRALLACGILAALVYVATDIGASVLYPGYSYTDQAVSELFAIGAPTSRFVVRLFTFSSILLLLFAMGVGRSSGRNRALRIMAWILLLGALNAIALWNFFPMHMRGDERGFTDTMHLILGANPLVLLSLVAGVLGFRSWFRVCSAIAIAVLLLPAVFAFQYVPEIEANQPTPWLGLAERVAQYAYQVWQVALAGILLRAQNSGFDGQKA